MLEKLKQCEEKRCLSMQLYKHNDKLIHYVNKHISNIAIKNVQDVQKTHKIISRPKTTTHNT